MAKKTTTRAKAEPKPEAAPAAAEAKPRTRAKAAKKADKDVTADPADPTTVSAASEPSDDDVRVRAYHRYLERGGGHGMDFEDWLEAKRELRELNDKK